MNGNISHNRFLHSKDNFLNGPPLRSLAFSTVVKDKDPPQVPLKSARIQNTDKEPALLPSSGNQHNSLFPSINSNASSLGKLTQSTTSRKGDKMCPSSNTCNESNVVPSNKLSSSSPISMLGHLQERQSGITSGMPTVVDTNFSLSTKQGGKIKTKIGSGLAQARAQRGCATVRSEEGSNPNNEQLQATQSLSTFLNPNHKLPISATMTFPNINFSSSSPLRSDLSKENIDTSFSQKALVSKASQGIIDKNQEILTRKAGAYESLNTTTSQNAKNAGNFGYVLDWV